MATLSRTAPSLGFRTHARDRDQRGACAAGLTRRLDDLRRSRPDVSILIEEALEEEPAETGAQARRDEGFAETTHNTSRLAQAHP